MNVKLIVIGGKKAGTEIPISTPKLLIGRGDECHIRPQSKLIGELHCLISVGDHSIGLEDCGGAIGTFVNGKKVQRWCGLQHNDRIKIGALELEVLLVAGEVGEKKKPIHAVQDTASRTVATDDGETDILNWVQQEEKVASSPPKVVALQYAKPEKSRKRLPAEPATQGRHEIDTDEFDEGFEWDAIDLLLLSTIGPLGLVLLSFVPTFWIWRGGGGILLVALASVFVTRMTRMNELKLDEVNIAIGTLAILVVSLMLPMYWVWWGGAVILLVVPSLVLGVRMQRMTGSKLDETNVALLAAIGILTLIVISLSVPATLWARLGEAVILLVALAAVLWLRRKRMTGRRSDRVMLLLAAIGIMLVVVLGFLFPIASWWPEWLNLRSWPDMSQCWKWFRWQVLRNWSSIWWLRWGGVAFLLAVLSVLISIHTRKNS